MSTTPPTPPNKFNGPPWENPELKPLFSKSKLAKNYIEKPIGELSGHKAWMKTANALSEDIRKHKLACIFGAPRTGKTTMAGVVLRTRMGMNGTPCFYGFLTQFLLDFEQRERLWEVIEDQYYEPTYLCLDECHLWHQTAQHSAWFDNAVSRRINEGSPTILIVEANSKSLRTFLPSGVANKLDATGAYFDCNWPSFPT